MEECNEELASEIELGSGTLRALWRWACYQARPQLSLVFCIVHLLHLYILALSLNFIHPQQFALQDLVLIVPD